MNPTLAAAIGAILRHVLTILAGYLVSKGIWTDAEASTYVTAAVAALVAFGWSLWTKYKGRLRLLKALELPAGATEAQVKREVDRDRQLGR